MTLIRIPKKNLRKGMFIELVECPQFFYDRRRFIVTQDVELEAIFATSAEFVLINTAKGASTGPGSDRSTDPVPAVGEDEEIRMRVAETLARSTSALKQGMAGIITGELRDLTALQPVADDMKSSMDHDGHVVLELTRMKTKDEGTFVHSFAVGALMTSVAQTAGMGADTVEMLAFAGLLHDVGKLLIPNEVLNKQGALSDAERLMIREHPARGHALLKTYPDIPEMVLDICRWHHEALDGSGYPDGLRAAALSPEVRISTVCDVFDALTTLRPYKRPWSAQQAIAWMFERDDKFDRKMLMRLSDVVDFSVAA